ncbi:MAG: DUF4178 domain-containing protein [Calditrichaeota bacterium]|nr:MAG: DUF4178 domain-containing protein [Calditrichota bacterium]
MSFFSKLKKSLFPVEESKSDIEKRNFFNIRCGDILTYYGEDYVVSATFIYEDGDFKWYSYGFKDLEENQKFLSVVEDDSLELVIWEEIIIPVNEPISSTFSHSGKSFNQTEHGMANVTRTIESGKKSQFRTEYWDFEAKDGEMLSIEKAGGSLTVSIGKSVKDFEIEILPGS